MLKPTLPKFYANEKGEYLGSFSGIQKLIGKYEDGTEAILHPGEFPIIPLDAKEISCAPSSMEYLWDFKKKKWIEKEITS